MKQIVVFYIIMLSCLPGNTQSAYLPEIKNLRCEYLVNPIGIDASHPRLTWQLADNRIGALQKSYRIIVGTDSAKVIKGIGETWNSGKVRSDKILITYNGSPLKPFTRYFWLVECQGMDNKILRSKVAFFETGFMERAVWKGNWISDGIDRDLNPAPYFRKEFDISRKVKTARIYIAVAGLYELYLNGEKQGNHRLDPMYTRFDRRTLYVTYDITEQLKQGKNAIGVMLGNGWYNHQSTAVWYFHQAPWRNRPTFCMDVRITWDDGSIETISSGNDWKTATGTVIFNSIYTAEHHDTRLEQVGWNLPGFDDSKWKQAELRSAPSEKIIAQALHPIRNSEKISPKTVTKINDSTYVFDLGRNISGVCEFKVKEAAGTVFNLKHGERLYENGRVDMSNIDVHYRPTNNLDPFQTDIFILSGKGEETFMPHFNYKGFQYVEITCNKPVKLSVENLNGYFMHSDLPPTGSIHSSNSTLNKLWWATNNSYLSNMFGYPTDCPQREKNGWTGDAHIAIETGLYNFDGITVYEKWLADHRDEQQPNGVLPAIIPTSGWGYQWANGPDWTSTIAIIPWNIYLFYGDTKLLADNYENIKRYVDHITDLYQSVLTDCGLGDWIPISGKPPVEFTSTVYYYVDVLIMANAARLLAIKDDMVKYSSLAEKIRKAFYDKYYRATTGIYGNGTQTELSMPLMWGLTSPGDKAKVAANLAKRVEADNFHLDVGLLGSKAVLNALSENGYADIAWRVASQETYPSWGWWIVNGATSLYENWPLDAKSDISLNHIMFGEVSAWMYKALGGIFPDPLSPGFKTVILKPTFPEGLEEFEAKHQTLYGEIVSGWKKHGTITYSVTIPPNTSGKLFIPDRYIINPVTRIKLQGNPNEEYYYLPAGSYKFELNRKDN